MTFFQAILGFFIIYLCVYTLISRICQCIERCGIARAFSKIKIDDEDARNVVEMLRKGKENEPKTN